MSDNLTLKTTAAQRDDWREHIASRRAKEPKVGFVPYGMDLLAVLDDLDTALAALAEAEAYSASLEDAIANLGPYVRDSLD